MTNTYTVVADSCYNGGYTYRVKRNGVYLTTCETMWGARKAVKRAIKADKQRPSKEEKLREKFPDFPEVYRVVIKI